jgi:hypothetical protein
MIETGVPFRPFFSSQIRTASPLAGFAAGALAGRAGLVRTAVCPVLYTRLSPPVVRARMSAEL